MNTIALGLKIFSTLSILVPIVIGLRRIPALDRFGKVFLGFLMAGLLTDLGMWYLAFHPVPDLPWRIFAGYSLLESLFFFYAIRRLSSVALVKHLATACLVLTPLLWVYNYFILDLSQGAEEQVVIFDAAYEVGVAFLAGLALLKLVESDRRPWQSSAFWILLSLFFYCFNTFFVMTLLGNSLSLDLWWLNNVVNIITYGGYAAGLSRHSKY